MDSFTRRIDASQASQIPTPERAVTGAYVTPYDLVAPEVLFRDTREKSTVARSKGAGSMSLCRLKKQPEEGQWSKGANVT